MPLLFFEFNHFGVPGKMENHFLIPVLAGSLNLHAVFFRVNHQNPPLERMAFQGFGMIGGGGFAREKNQYNNFHQERFLPELNNSG